MRDADPRSARSRALHRALEAHYREWNRREHVHPDPLEFVYRYEDRRDREVAALVASSLSFGTVKQILASVEQALAFQGPTPAAFLKGTSEAELERRCRGFKHRWIDGEALAGLLMATKRVFEDFGTMEACFLDGCQDSDEDMRPGMARFARHLSSRGAPDDLVSRPERGSACKRLLMLLRWMVRCDDVDPGCWKGVPASKLLVPLDTHMHRLGRALGFTLRAAADMRAALEVTAGFAALDPSDPVRYDFTLTRLAMRRHADLADLIERHGPAEEGEGR